MGVVGSETAMVRTRNTLNVLVRKLTGKRTVARPRRRCSSLLSKNIKIEIYRNIILPVMYGCETWSLTLRGTSAEGVRE
jgi:hypothetical protein